MKSWKVLFIAGAVLLLTTISLTHAFPKYKRVRPVLKLYDDDEEGEEKFSCGCQHLRLEVGMFIGRQIQHSCVRKRFSTFYLFFFFFTDVEKTEKPKIKVKCAKELSVISKCITAVVCDRNLICLLLSLFICLLVFVCLFFLFCFLFDLF